MTGQVKGVACSARCLFRFWHLSLWNGSPRRKKFLLRFPRYDIVIIAWSMLRAFVRSFICARTFRAKEVQTKQGMMTG